MIKVETKLYLNDKEILNYFEELDLDVFKKKVYKDVEIHSMAFDRLIFSQKQIKGKKAPELIEEAIELLLKKYGEKLES